MVSCSNMREKIRGMEKFIKLGESIKNNITEDNREVIEEFIRQSEELDKHPVVKNPTKVSYISFESDDDCLGTIEEIIENYGNIATLGPVQVIQHNNFNSSQ